MSTTVDERVVEMRFDNDQFESNVNQSMSTLAKLKQSLKLTGASKGLEAVNTAAKKVNFTPIVNGMDGVVTKFSHAQMTLQHQIDRWADRIVNSAERAIKALTIDPVKSGFQEYETQINSVQTILANTESKGSTIEDVNNALEELNKYADKTIYNFTEMTRNIGTFTAAGVDLETSTNAIQGIANLAAVSGSTSQQASTAMYQLSQALASGTVKLMDWNSVVNAGMGGEVFQNALKETARVHGVAIDDMIKKNGSFRETLKDGWLTSEILTETLQKFTLATEGVSEEQVEANRQMLKAKGYTEEQIEEIFKLGNTATNAATKVKTLTQLWDVLKEAAQSGWAGSWKAIFGDFKEAKEWLSPIAEGLANIIGKAAEFRNKILDKAFNNPFADAIKSIKGVTDSIGEAVKSVTDYEKVVNEIIGGKWGNGQARWDKLTEAGYDWAHAQNLVNEKLGNSYRRATDYKEAQDAVNESVSRAVEELVEYDDAKLKDLGYSDDQIEALRLLKRQSEITGHSVAEIYENPDLISGRTLLVDSFKNTGKAIMDVFAQIKGAWNDVFHGENATEEDIINKRAMQIYDVISAIRDFTNYLEVNDETADKLRRTFKGLFAIIDIVTTLVGGGFKIAFKIVKSILGFFDMDILDLTAHVGDVLVKFRDWIDSVLDLDGVVSKIIPMLIKGGKAIKAWGEAFVNLPFVQKAITAIKDAFHKLSDIDFRNINLSSIFASIKNALSSLKGENYSSIGEFIWDGLIVGLAKGVVKVVKAIVNCASELIDRFKETLGIHSPSKVFMALGGFIVAGLVLGIKEGAIEVPEALTTIVNNGIDAIKNIDFGKVMAATFGIAILSFFNKLGTAFENFSQPFGAFADVLEETSKAIKRVGKSFAKLTKAVAFNQNMKGIKQLAIAIAILAGTVVAIAYVITKYDLNMWEAVGMIATLAAVLVGMAVAMNLLSKASIDISKNGIKMDGMTSSLLSMAVAIAILALTVKLISTIPFNAAVGGFVGLAVIMGFLVTFIWLCGKVGDYKSVAVISKLSGLLIKLSISILLMVLVCKLVSKLKPEEMVKGCLFAITFLVFVGTLAKLTRKGGDISKVGGMMVKMAIALALMVLVCKLVSKLDPVDALAGFAFAMIFTRFVKALVKATKIADGQKIAKLGGLLLSVSLSMMLMVGVCKLVGKLSDSDLLKGAAFAIGFLIFVKSLVKISKTTNDKQMAKLSGTILAIAAAIGILAIVAMILSLMKISDLAKGVIAVGILALMMTGLIKALKGAQNVKGSIIAMAVAIGVLAAAIALLSLIDPKKLIAPTIAMGLLMGMFAVMLKSSRKIKVDSLPTIIALVVAMGLMAGLLALLANVDAEASIQNAIALGVMMLAMSATMVILSKMKSKAMDSLKAIGLLTAMAVPMAAFIIMLQILGNIDSAGKNALLLVGVMTAMTLLLVALSAIGNLGSSALKGIGLLTAMAIPMAAFVALIYFIPDIAGAKDKVLLVTTLMTAMTLLLAVLAVIGFAGTSALVGVALLTAMVIPLAAFVAAIYFMPDIAGAKDKIVMVTNLMVAMTLLLGVLAIIGIAGVTALVGIGLLTAMVIPMAVFVAAIYFMPDITGARANIELLIQTMTAMVILLAILAIIGPLASVGVGALTSLIGVMAAVGLMAAAIGALIELFPTLETFINTGLDLLIKLAGGIGEMIGAFIGGAITQIMASLPDIGTSLSLFMENLTPFIEGLRQIDGSLVESALSLVGIFLALTAADLVAGIVSWITGSEGVNFDSLADSLISFARGVIGFSNAITEGGGINTEAVDAAVRAGELMLKLQTSLPRTGGWIQKICGEQDLTKFGASCVAFAQSMIDFGKAVEAGGGIKDDIIASAAKAGTAMSELQNSLPRTGGWIQRICGEEDLVKFGTSCVEFAKSMCKFSRAVEEGGGINEDDAKVAAKAGELFVALQNNLPAQGGTWQSIVGEKETLAMFGESCLAFGNALTTFSSSVNIKQDAVDVAAKAGEMMAQLQNNIPTKTWFDGKADLEDFGKKIVSYGEKLLAYSDEVQYLDNSKVQKSLDATLTLVEVARSLQYLDADTVVGDMGAITTLGDYITSFYNGLEGVNAATLGSIVDIVGRMRIMISNMVGLDTSGVESFKSAIESLGETKLSDVVDAFNNGTDALIQVGYNIVDAISSGVATEQGIFNNAIEGLVNGAVNVVNNCRNTFGEAGKRLMNVLISTIEKAESSVSGAMKSTVTACLATVRNQAPAFTTAGGNLAEGFANGISANSYMAVAQAKAMAEAAEQAAKEALGINSPSKVFYSIGDYTGQGFINALAGYAKKAYNSATDMGNSAKTGLNDALNKAYDIIQGNMETQPTIRPVLDLSSVEAGAGRMQGLLNGVSNVGVMTNMNAIGSMMERRRQNGSNADVVSAIDKLRKKMDNFGNTTYQVGDVTAEEGSGVATAVESLVGAIRREGRA